MRVRALVPLLLVARAAWGDAGWVHPSVEVAIDPCVEVRRDDVQRIVGIELGATGEAPWPETVQVRVVCREKLVEVQVDDPVTRKSLSRTINLTASAGGVRARLLALAIAELVSASWTELESNPDPEVLPAGPAPSEMARQGALGAAQRRFSVPRSWRLRLLAEATMRYYRGGFAPQWGGGARLVLDFQYFGLWVELGADHGATSFPEGTMLLDTLDVAAGAVVRRGWSRAALSGGVGLRGGAAHLTGIPANATPSKPEQWGGWLTLLATASVTVAATRTLALEVGLEGGYVVYYIEGTIGMKPVARTDGPWAGVVLGIGFFP